MLSKKWLLGACGGVVASLAVSAAHASLRIDTTLRSIDGITNPANAALNGAWDQAANSVNLTLLGGNNHTFSVDIVVLARGGDTSTNERLQSVIGSLQAANGLVGLRAAHGTFTPRGSFAKFLEDDEGNPIPDPTGGQYFGLDPFNKSGTQNGQPALDPIDVVPSDLLPLDGNLDYGSDPNNELGTGDLVAIRGSDLLAGGVGVGNNQPNAGRRWTIGKFDWVMDSVGAGLGETVLSWEPRRATDGSFPQSAALWGEDSFDGKPIAKDGKSGLIIVDQPGQNLSLTTVPEPSALGAIGLGVLGLASRIRRRK